MTKPPPDDVVLYHILPRLPIKSLMRFRCVCKSWNSFILDPSFVHLRQAATHTYGHHLLFLYPASTVATYEPHVFSALLCEGQADMAPASATHILTMPNHTFSEVAIQCVNGLFCLHPKNPTRFSSHSDAFAQICNPTTRQVITLPDDTSISKNFMVSTHFGFDPIRDEFKVLRLLKYKDSYELKILTVGANSWRIITPIRHFNTMKHLLKCRRGLCINGVIYWTDFFDILHQMYSSSYIIAFDFGSEQLKKIRIPYGYSYRELTRPHLSFPNLVELSGCLSLVGYKDGVLNLWILKDYQNQVWIQKSIILPSGIGCVHFPLCTVPSGEILLLPYFIPRRVRVIYHNMDKMSSRSAVIMAMPQPLWPDPGSGDVDIFFYKESFRLLK